MGSNRKIQGEPYYFVCYARENSDTVRVEITWLQKAGIDLWFDEDIPVGATWREALAGALEGMQGLIFMCSQASLDSTHCQKEISFALDLSKPVFVVRLDDSPFPRNLALYLNDTQSLSYNQPNEQTYRAKLLAGLTGIAPAQSPAGITTRPGKTSYRWAVMALVAVVLSLAALTTYQYTFRTEDLSRSEVTPIAGSQREPTVALLSTHAEEVAIENLNEALAAAIRNELAVWLFKTTTLPLSDKDLSPLEIGQRHEVDYLWYWRLSRVSDEQIRVFHRLVDARSGSELSSLQHDLRGDDVFGMDLSRTVGEAAYPLNSIEISRAASVPRSERTALQLIYAPDASHADLMQAVELTPHNPWAYLLVANRLYTDVVFNLSSDPQRDAKDALALATRGYALAPYNATAVDAVGRIELAFGDPEKALSYVSGLAEEKVFSGNGFYYVLLANGRTEQALAHALANPSIDPQTTAYIYMDLGAYADAEAAFRKQMERYSVNPMTMMLLANALALQGKHAVASKIVEDIQETVPQLTAEALESGLRIVFRNEGLVAKLTEGLKRLEVR